MRKLLSLLIIWIAIPVFAQSPEPVAAAFQPLEVTNVRLRLSEDEGASLVFNASPAVCEDLLLDISIEGNFIDVEVFAPRSDAVCNFIAPYEPVIPLENLETGQAYVLFLNDFTSTFFVPDRDAQTTVEAFATVWGMDNLLVSFTPVAPILDDIFVTTMQDITTIELSGNHADGCITEEYTRIYQDDVQNNLYHVQTFRLLTEFVMCPAQLIPFHETISIELSPDDVVEVDGRYFRVSDRLSEPVLADRLTIDSVEILPTASSNIVAVSGTQTQDCGVDFTEYVSERDYISLIDIVAYVPLDSACTDNITLYETSFTVASLPIVINGVAYDENGEIDSITSAQSVLPERNFMPVDTVIESVDILILESFPMQLSLEISGYQPDGCDFPVVVEQRVEENNVRLHIFRNVPPDTLCPMSLVPYEESILVDGSFEGGTVTIEVNEFSTEIDL